MSFITKIDPSWERFGIYDVFQVFRDGEDEHSYPKKFPFKITYSLNNSVVGEFDKRFSKHRFESWDDHAEAKRRWEEHQRLVTMLREVRTYLSPPSEITMTPYVKELLERIDEV